MPTADIRNELNNLLERLRDPLRLRVFIAGAVLAIGYAGVYMPLSGRIDDTTRKLSAARRRHELAAQIEHLRAEVEKFQARLPEKTDTNQWIQYVLDGVRSFPVTLNRLDPGSPQRVGPYEAVVLEMELAGAFQELDAFLHWLETNERLFQVDSVHVERARRESEHLVMRLTVLGLKG